MRARAEEESRSEPEARVVRRWTTRVVQEFEFEADTADDALALARALETRRHSGCILIDYGAYTAERGSRAGWQTNPTSVTPEAENPPTPQVGPSDG